jgi:hypothetical protein
MLRDSTLDLRDRGRILFTGTNDAALLGSGEVKMGSVPSTNWYLDTTCTRPVTIGPGILIHGNGRILDEGAGIIYQGTVTSDVAGGTLSIDGRVTNQGTIESLNGGKLELTTSRYVQDAGILRSSGDLPTSGWGLMQISGGSVNVGGALGLPGSGGTVVLGLVTDGPSVPLNVASVNQNEVAVHNTGVLTISVSSNRVTSNINRLTIDGNGVMDLGNKGLLVDNVATPEAAVRQYLRNGYNANPTTGIGDWNGKGGITSADAIASHNGVTPDFRVSIGYVNGAYAKDPLVGGFIPGQPSLATNRTLIRPALYGDLNVDGKVDDTDLAIFSGLGQYNQPTGKFGWLGVDLNYDGKVDDTDLQIFSGAGNYNGPSYGAGAASATHASATPNLTGHAAADGDIVPSAATSEGEAGDGVLDIVYDPASGTLKISYDGDPRITASQPLQVIRLNSAGGKFIAANFNQSAFGAGVTANASSLNGTASGSNSVPDSYDLGAVLPTGLQLSDLISDLTLQ